MINKIDILKKEARLIVKKLITSDEDFGAPVAPRFYEDVGWSNVDKVIVAAYWMGYAHGKRGGSLDD